MSLASGVIAVVVITLIWASSFVITKDSLDSIPVALLAALRFSLALGSLLWVKPKRSALKPGLWLGLLESAAFISLLLGLTSTTASKAAFIFAFNALIAPLASAWFLVVYQKLFTLPYYRFSFDDPYRTKWYQSR
jgi:drug/metabolite transporter (DMT)-like permease